MFLIKSLPSLNLNCQFKFKLGNSQANQEAWRVKLGQKDDLIKSLEEKLKFSGESIDNLRDNLHEAKRLLVNKMVEEPIKMTDEPMTKKARTT